VCLGVKHISGAYEQIFIAVRELRVCSRGAVSDERMGLPIKFLLLLASAVILGTTF
jgi:hypothetical protein